MPDLETTLRQSPLTPAQRADLWDAFQDAKDADDLAAKLQTLNVPKQVKADLWDMKAAGTTTTAPGELAVPKDAGSSSFSALGQTLLRPDQTLLGAGKRILQLGHDATIGATGFPTPGAFLPDGPMQEGGGTALDIAAISQGTGALARAAAGAVTMPNAVGAAARWAASNPTAAGAITGAVPGVLSGDLRGAATGAALGALGVKSVPGLARRVLPTRPIPPTPKVAARPVEMASTTTTAAPPAVPVPGPKAVVVPARNTPIRKPPTPKKVAAPKADTAEPIEPPVKILDKGAAAAADHRARVAFAREIAATNPKVGEKIWMQLDASGRPVKALTPDQAGAAARKGEATTWIRNLWQ